MPWKIGRDLALIFDRSKQFSVPEMRLMKSDGVRGAKILASRECTHGRKYGRMEGQWREPGLTRDLNE